MKHIQPVAHESYPDTHHDIYSKTIFGFWVYLLTDLVLFGTFFATFLVLRHSTFGGPGPKELFQLDFGLMQTIILLTASFTSGLAGAATHRKNTSATVMLFGITFLLGAIFLSMEMTDLSRLIASGNGWQRSAFLSAFFTLVGTHAIHVVFALLWVIVLLIPVIKEGIDSVSIRRLTCLRIFWQFLNIIWLFIFTLVYFMGEKSL